MDKMELWNELSRIMFEAQTTLPEADFHRRLSILAVKAEAIGEDNLAKLSDSFRDEIKDKGYNRRKYGMIYAIITNDLEGIANAKDRDLMIDTQKVIDKYEEDNNP